MATNKLVRGSTVVVIVDGEFGPRGYFGTCLGHDGNFTVTKCKVTAGENYADTGNGHLIFDGITYFTDLPHGDETQGGTWIWPHEVPAGFYVG